MEIAFNCPQCSQRLTVDAALAGQPVSCPTCGQVVTVPVEVASAPPPVAPPAVSAPGTAGVIYCPKCGQQNGENNYQCTRCGYVLHGPARPQFLVEEDGTMGGLIPYKNQAALWAYYLGIFSLIPCAGIPLGIAAAILGIKGLKHAEAHPEAKGKGHAWTGIILGGACAALNVLGIIGVVISASK